MKMREENGGRIVYKTDKGEYELLVTLKNISFEPQGISHDNNMKFTGSGEMTFELTEEGKQFVKRFLRLCARSMNLAKRTVLCNNWRRRHHLPLIRKKRR